MWIEYKKREYQESKQQTRNYSNGGGCGHGGGKGNRGGFGFHMGNVKDPPLVNLNLPLKLSSRIIRDNVRFMVSDIIRITRINGGKSWSSICTQLFKNYNYNAIVSTLTESSNEYNHTYKQKDKVRLQVANFNNVILTYFPEFGWLIGDIWFILFFI